MSPKTVPPAVVGGDSGYVKNQSFLESSCVCKWG